MRLCYLESRKFFQHLLLPVSTMTGGSSQKGSQYKLLLLLLFAFCVPLDEVDKEISCLPASSR